MSNKYWLIGCLFVTACGVVPPVDGGGAGSGPGQCGAIGLTCPTGFTCCAGTCIDLTSSPSNCGACGAACGGDQSCCGGACAAVSSDPRNCGACGQSCAPGSTCADGACVQ